MRCARNWRKAAGAQAKSRLMAILGFRVEGLQTVEGLLRNEDALEKRYVLGGSWVPFRRAICRVAMAIAL